MGDKIRVYKNADISVAVQTDAGLMVPIVRNACGLGLSGISSEVRALAGKAKEGKLYARGHDRRDLHDLATSGCSAIKQFAAIVNPPQAAILAVGAARKGGREEGGRERVRGGAPDERDAVVRPQSRGRRGRRAVARRVQGVHGGSSDDVVMIDRRFDVDE